MNNGVKKKIKKFNEYELSIKNFKLGKMFKYDLEVSYIKVYYNQDNIVFKSPMMFMPSSPVKINNQSRYLTNNHYYIDLLFYNGDNDPDVIEFEKWYNKLEDIVYKLLKKRAYLKVRRRNFRTNFYYDEYKKSNKIKMRIDSVYSKFYLLNQLSKLSNKVNFTDMKYPTYGLFIIELENVWIKRPIILDDDDNDESIFGLNFIIHASQCLPSHCVLNNLNITDNDFDSNKLLNFKDNSSLSLAPLAPPPPPLPPNFSLTSNNNSSNNGNVIPEFIQKFMDMMKKGVPREAVKHKMKMQGINPDLLDNPYSISNIPLSNNNSMSNSNNSISKITSDMLKDVKLKKCIIDEEGNKKKKVSNYGFNISLDDILNIKSKLKKQPIPKIYEKPRYNEDSNSSLSDYTDTEDETDKINNEDKND